MRILDNFMLAKVGYVKMEKSLFNDVLTQFSRLLTTATSHCV